MYCGAGCQREDWKAHKGNCAELKAAAATDRCNLAQIMPHPAPLLPLMTWPQPELLQ